MSKIYKQKMEQLIDHFLQTMPDAKTELNYSNPYQLLIAVILSAQCTDKRVNLVTPPLFKDFPSPYHIANSSVEIVFPYLKSISYPNNKTKHIIESCKIIVQKYNGQIPLQVSELMELPGVGRKTANVISSVIDKQPNMAVDTHVYRVSKRIGLVPTTAKSFLSVEKALIKIIPTDQIHIAHHWLILHGRYVCKAIKPACVDCAIKMHCNYFKKNKIEI